MSKDHTAGKMTDKSDRKVNKIKEEDGLETNNFRYGYGRELLIRGIIKVFIGNQWLSRAYVEYLDTFMSVFDTLS